MDDESGLPPPRNTRYAAPLGALSAALLLLGAALPLFTGGCKTGFDGCGGYPPATSGETQIRTELFFGLTRPAGADVSEAEFAQFLKDEVTPRFPQGYSVIGAQGHWHEQSGRDREEPSRVLILIHPTGKDPEMKIEEIRKAYKTKFSQEAVLRTDEMEKVSF